MSDLPLAKVLRTKSIWFNDQLLIYVEISTDSVDSKVVIESEPNAASRPTFVVRERSGNAGINPTPGSYTKSGVASFSKIQKGAKVFLHDSASQSKEITVIQSSTGWIAHQNLMPMQKGHLIVVGFYSAPTPNYVLELSEVVPQGINAKILMLRLIKTPPPGSAADVITLTPVYFKKEASDPYDKVQIPDEHISIPVEIFR